MTTPDPTKTRIKQAVTELLSGSGLHIQELPNELVITNPHDPDKGQVHIDLTTGYISWEHVTWTHWGTLAGLPETGESVISGAKILDTLLDRT